MNKKYLNYIILVSLVLGSIPFGALMIVPIFLLFFSLTEKDGVAFLSLALVVYFLGSTILNSFNILLFLALLLAFIFLKYRSFIVPILLSVLCIASAFVPVPADYLLISFFVVGLALMAIGNDEVRRAILGSRDYRKEETQDPILQRYEEIERQLGFK